MALTVIDPSVALVVVDLQQGVVAMASAGTVAGVVTQAAALADAFRSRGLPVVLVNVEGVAPGRAEQARRMGDLPPGWSDIVPELNAQAADIRVTKKTWGAFTCTRLESHLRQAGVTQIVLCGVATSIGVESTARFAHELGFNLTFATDAMTDLVPEAHAHSVTRIFPRLGETGSTADIIALLPGSQQKRSA